MAGGYPVPPLPGQTLPPVPRRRSRRDRALVGQAAVPAVRTAGDAAENTDGKEADGA